jgi:hypothetical protein
MEKEKSVLTEADKKEIINNVWDRKVGCADTEYIMRETEQKVLSNYKKGLREKVQEKIKKTEAEYDITRSKDNRGFLGGKIAGYEGLLKELGEK